MSTQVNKKSSIKGKNYWPHFLFLLSVLLYANTFHNDYALDDDIYTTNNTFVKEGIKGIPQIITNGSLAGYNGTNDGSYRPFVLISFAIEKAFFGFNPHISHFFNIILFAFTSLLLFKFLKRILVSFNIWIPIFVSIIFICHPIHTEVVANIKGRDEILALFFGLLSFNQFLNFIDFQRYSNLLISTLSFFLSLLCKETSVSFIAIFPLIAWFFSSIDLKNFIKYSLAFVPVLVSYFCLRYFFLDSIVLLKKVDVFNNSLMAANSSIEMYPTIIYLLGKYLLLLFYPHPLICDYSYNQIPIFDWTYPLVLISLALNLALLGYAILKFKEKNVFSFAILFFNNHFIFQFDF